MHTPSRCGVSCLLVLKVRVHHHHAFTCCILWSTITGLDWWTALVQGTGGLDRCSLMRVHPQGCIWRQSHFRSFTDSSSRRRCSMNIRITSLLQCLQLILEGYTHLRFGIKSNQGRRTYTIKVLMLEPAI